MALHDARFATVPHGWRQRGNATIDLAAWDYTRRPHCTLFVRLLYRDAELLAPGLDAFHHLVMDRHTEVLYGELDHAAEGRFEHRMLLWPRDAPELVIRFADLEIVAARFDGMNAEVVDLDAEFSPPLPP